MAVENKIRLWAGRAGQANHKLIKAFFAAQGRNPNVDAGVNRESMKNAFLSYGEDEERWNSNFPQMKTNAGNANGKVFEERQGNVYIDDNTLLKEQLRIHMASFLDSVVVRNGEQLNSPEPSNGLFEHMNNISLNTILFGPPGTGKTYNSIAYAVAICDGEDKLEENGLTWDNNGNPCIKPGKENFDKAHKRFEELKDEGRIAFTTFHQSYGYEEFIEGLKPESVVHDGRSDIDYKVVPGIFKDFCDKAGSILKEKTCVFIIDEINRGNISKIFGELITLIEDSKRVGMPEGMNAVLPYSKEPFGVPQNVYILGTMNTADRSIALMDTALRRRFSFVEMMPNTDVLKKADASGDLADLVVDGINVPKMLETINARIEALYDREHAIGHAFFTGLLKTESPSVKDVADIFKNKVIPLLQEYFYEDYGKIRMILGDNFVKKIPKVDFAVSAGAEDVEDRYKICDVIPISPNTYQSIYSTVPTRSTLSASTTGETEIEATGAETDGVAGDDE